MHKFKESYKRNLPHIQPLAYSFFVTFRLKDSIPRAQLKKLNIVKEWSSHPFTYLKSGFWDS